MNVNLTAWILLPLCVAASCLLSGMEAGVFALSRLRVRQQARAGRPAARMLRGFLDNPENFLWTIVVGNTLANFLILGWVFAELFQRLAEQRWLFAAVYAALVCVFYAFFDLLPKMLFRAYPNRLCLGCAPVFRVIHLALRPVVAVVEACSRVVLRLTGSKAFSGHLFGNREELRLIMLESAQGFTSEERAMIKRVLELPSLTVRAITRSLADVITISVAAPVGDLLSLARDHALSRLPVWEEREGRRRIAGLAVVDRLLFQGAPDCSQPVGRFLKPALYVSEDDPLEAVLRRMQRANQPLAVVLARDKRELGVVSIEDILKAIFGEVKL